MICRHNVETEQFLGFVSWMKSTEASQKRQKKFLLKALNLFVQGNLRNIQWKLFCSIKIHDQITAAWWNHSRRRWWSSKIWRPLWTNQGKVRWYFGMDSWCLDSLPGRKRRTKEKVSILLWILSLPNISCISKQFRDIQEVISLNIHCKTMYCYRMTLPSTSNTSGTLTKCTPVS